MEGIIQTTIDCTEHNRILAAYDQKNFEEARATARRSFLNG